MLFFPNSFQLISNPNKLNREPHINNQIKRLQFKYNRFVLCMEIKCLPGIFKKKKFSYLNTVCKVKHFCTKCSEVQTLICQNYRWLWKWWVNATQHFPIAPWNPLDHQCVFVFGRTWTLTFTEPGEAPRALDVEFFESFRLSVRVREASPLLRFGSSCG